MEVAGVSPPLVPLSFAADGVFVPGSTPSLLTASPAAGGCYAVLGASPPLTPSPAVAGVSPSPLPRPWRFSTADRSSVPIPSSLLDASSSLHAPPLMASFASVSVKTIFAAVSSSCLSRQEIDPVPWHSRQHALSASEAEFHSY
jgi:hypothetical protein